MWIFGAVFSFLTELQTRCISAWFWYQSDPPPLSGHKASFSSFKKDPQDESLMTLDGCAAHLSTVHTKHRVPASALQHSVDAAAADEVVGGGAGPGGAVGRWICYERHGPWQRLAAGRPNFRLVLLLLSHGMHSCTGFHLSWVFLSGGVLILFLVNR